MYDEDVIQDMLAKFNLLEYASQTLELKRRGSKSDNTLYASCPLHVDKTPSLVITHKEDEPDLFYCQSCKRGGAAINWFKIYEGLEFVDAVEKLSKITGTTAKSVKRPSSVIFFNKMKALSRCNCNESKIERRILPDSSFNRFSEDVPDEWVSEGMSVDVLKRYNIVIDRGGNRIVYPIYDNSGNLISFKGRTRFPMYKKMGIVKYIFYTEIGTNDFFVGMKENREFIESANEVIIFEGIKSGMILSTFSGRYNWLAAETSCLNDDQIKILLGLNVKDVVIAFDSDVELDKIKHRMQVLRKFKNVYAVYDRWNLLGGAEAKNSPVDRGKETWDILYKERVRI